MQQQEFGMIGQPLKVGEVREPSGIGVSTRFWRLILAGGIVALAGANSAQACPMCAYAMAEGTSGQSGDIPTAFYYSIIFMMSMPFILTCFFGLMYYRLQLESPMQNYVPPGDDSETITGGCTDDECASLVPDGALDTDAALVDSTESHERQHVTV